MILAVYLALAVTTAITSSITHFTEAISNIEDLNPESPILQSKLVAYATYICLATLVAPFIFVALILPATHKKFVEGMSESLIEKES